MRRGESDEHQLFLEAPHVGYSASQYNNDDAEETELRADKISYILRLLEFRPSNPKATNPTKPQEPLSDLPFQNWKLFSKQLNTEKYKLVESLWSS